MQIEFRMTFPNVHFCGKSERNQYLHLLTYDKLADSVRLAVRFV